MVIETDALGGFSRSTCRALAQIEEREKGDQAAARRWLDAASSARPDAAWICRQCGTPGDAGPESGHWQLICPHCESLDSLEWRHPAGGRAGGTALAPMIAPSQPANLVDRPAEFEILPAPVNSRVESGSQPISSAASVDAARLIN